MSTSAQRLPLIDERDLVTFAKNGTRKDKKSVRHPGLVKPKHPGVVAEVSPSARVANETIKRIRVTHGEHVEEPLDGSVMVHGDALAILSGLPENSFHAIVTDPPYGLIEYEDRDLDKLKSGKGGVWRLPPSYDGVARRPLPRFTVLTSDERVRLVNFFSAFAAASFRVLVPGGHILVAANPLLSSQVFCALERAGFEKRGEVIRQLQTLRGGDRRNPPPGAALRRGGLAVSLCS